MNTRERKACPLGIGAWVTAPAPDVALRQPGPYFYVHDLLILAALSHDFGTAEADAEIGFCDTNTL